VVRNKRDSGWKPGICAALAGALALGTLAASAVGGESDPWTTKLKDGSTFRLADSIKKKVQDGDAVNYVFSYQSSAIKGFSEQYKAGFEATRDQASKILPMNFKAIAPSVPQGDVQQQIQQIQALANTNQIDCLSIEPATSDGFTNITNQLMAKGIPVFTAGLTTNGNELTNFTQVPLKEGATAANTVLAYMKRTGKTFSVGWNVTPEQIDALKNGTQIALFDQKWPEQAGFGALACANYLKTGKVLPNSQTLFVVNKSNYQKALADLKRLTGGK
jgi:ABC-type sugar transport system substrate-binding protein